MLADLFKWVPPNDYKPHEIIRCDPFTSSTSDLRIAGKFMYGAKDPSQAKGAIFKIWGKTPTVSLCTRLTVYLQWLMRAMASAS